MRESDYPGFIPRILQRIEDHLREHVIVGRTGGGLGGPRAVAPGDLTVSGLGKYEERDREIKALLLSRDPAEQKQGLVRLIEAFQEKTAIWLQDQGSNQKDLTDGTALTIEELEDIWQETICCISHNVLVKGFEDKGSLFAYVLTIANCRRVDQWRAKRANQRLREKRIELGRMDELTGIVHPTRQIGLYEDLEVFYETRKEEDRVALRLDVKLHLKNGYKWVPAIVLTNKLNKVRCLKGWAPKSISAVRSWRFNIRKDLREFLRKRGYDV